MSEVRIRRGGNSRMSVKDRKRAPSSRKRGKSAASALLARLPVSHATVQRVLTWVIVAAVAVVFLGMASFFGLPGMARMEAAELAARAGYEVKKVEVTGTRRMDEQQVYAIALGQVDRSMLNVDLQALRQQLMQLPWVKDARVSRRLPDTLAVDIVEREPAAVWQNEGKLALIDKGGVVLEPVSINAMPDLPLVVGTDANLQAVRLGRLLEAAPALKPVVSGATWVGNRRWDLRFQSGETLSLPEGDSAAAAALVTFARLDGINHLLGRGIRRFDMRDPDKFVLRLPKDKASAATGGTAAPAANVPQPVTREEQGDNAATAKKEG